MYVLDCLKALRDLDRMLVGVVVRYVKNFAAGLLLWNCRTGADLKAVLEAPSSAEESFIGCRIVNAILLCCMLLLVMSEGAREVYLRRKSLKTMMRI